MPDNAIPANGAEETARAFEAQWRRQDAELNAAVEAKQARTARLARESAAFNAETRRIADIGDRNRP